MSSGEYTPKPLISVIGCPGAGKGTLCKKLAAEYNGRHLSVGDLLRATIQDDDDRPESRALTPYIRDGTLVPTDMLLRVLQRAIAQGVPGNAAFLLLDGFPRQLDQGIEFGREVQKPDLVVFLHCDRAVAELRFRTRKLPGRLDDDVEMFRRRYAEFEALNGQIVEHYRARGVLVQVDSNRDTSTSYQNLVRALSEREEWMGILAGSKID